MAKSIMDYIFKWLAIKFLSPDSQDEAGVIRREGGSGGEAGGNVGAASRRATQTNDSEGSSSGAKTAAPKASAQNVVALNKDDKEFVKDLATPTGLPLATHLAGPTNAVVMLPERNADAPRPKTTLLAQADARSCSDCGAIMVRNGACYKCLNCGSTSGCS